MDVLSKVQEEKNRAKYGSKEMDVISQMYHISKAKGDVYCGGNAIKYIRRFIGDNEKAGNILDIDKAIDYLTRIKIKADELRIIAKAEVIETTK